MTLRGSVLTPNGPSLSSLYSCIEHPSPPQCKQHTGQSLTDLLDYMRPLWAELEIEKNLKLKVLEFIGALTPQIQKDLFLLPTDRRDTLAAVEEQVNVIY
jgi:hypothetical protein